MNQQTSFRIFFFTLLAAILAMLNSSCIRIESGSVGTGNVSYFRETYDHAEQYHNGPATYDAEIVTDLDINWASDSVVIRYIDGDKVSIWERSNQTADSAQMHWWLEDSTLHIQYCAAGCHKIKDSWEKTLYVELPASVRLKDIDVETISALVLADSLSAEEISIESVSGSISIGEVNVPDFNMGTVSGYIKASSITTREGSCESVSGSISIDQLNASDFNMETVSGYIQAKANVSEELTCESVSGSVRITSTTPYKAELETTSGKINVPEVKVKSKKSLSIGTSGTRISIETVSGNITLKQQIAK